MGDRFLSSAGAGGNCARPMRLPDPSPVLDKNRAPMGPEILSSAGAGVWRKAPMAFPDSSSVLDKFQSARELTSLTEFWGKLGEFCEKLDELALHTNNRPRGTHWVLSPELGEGKKLTEFGVWNRTLRNRIRPVSGFCRPARGPQNRTIAIASDFRVEWAKSPEIPQKEGVLSPEIADRNRKSLATFNRTLKSQCNIAFSYLENRREFWGPRWASQSQITKIAAISVR